jgi:hypothetical protein
MKTSYYSNRHVLCSPDLIKVGITAYHPRFRLAYELAGNITLLAPARNMLKMQDQKAFASMYFQRLDAATVSVIRARIQGFAVVGKEVVLLCYENLSDGTKWCHRRLFAQWWEARTGEPVGELGNCVPDEADGQLTMF